MKMQPAAQNGMRYNKIMNSTALTYDPGSVSCFFITLQVIMLTAVRACFLAALSTLVTTGLRNRPYKRVGTPY